MKKLFERRELKYILTDRQAEILLEVMKEDLVPDEFEQYRIHSLYFDNDHFDLMRKSLDRPVYKEKLRVRSYRPALKESDPVFLEIKKKYEGIVYKRRIDFELSQALDFLKNLDDETITGKEISQMIIRNRLEPKFYIRYDRWAYVWKEDPDIRITFDENAAARFEDLKLQESALDEPILEKGKQILEIKARSGLPFKLIKAMEKAEIRPASFSKAGAAYAKYILKRKDRYDLPA